VSVLGVTDHDTLGGLDEALAAGAREGVRVLPGVELSAGRRGGRLHLLGYLRETAPEPLAATVASLRHVRAARAGRILGRLAERGVVLDLACVEARAHGPIGRPHIAAEMVARGYASSLQDAFDRYLADEHGASEPVGSLGPEEAIGLILGSGGVPVLAHPWTLGLDAAALREQLAGWRDAGLAGLEAYRPDHDDVQRETLRSFAADLGLVATGGSDFHRPEPGQAVGGVGPVPLPETTISALGL
jgi:predicted metal-dependent phosphoesterase TrpH